MLSLANIYTLYFRLYISTVFSEINYQSTHGGILNKQNIFK